VKEVYDRHSSLQKDEEFKKLKSKCELIQKIEKKREDKHKKTQKHLHDLHHKRCERNERWKSNLQINRIDKLKEMRQSLIQKQFDIQDRIDNLKKEKAIEVIEKKANLDEKVAC